MNNIQKHTNNLSKLSKQRESYTMEIDECMDLFASIKHGTLDHQVWLMQAIVAWACDGEMPDERRL